MQGPATLSQLLRADGTGAADEAEESVGSSSRPSDPSRRTEDADSMATLAAGVAITFLFQVTLSSYCFARQQQIC